MNPGARHAPRAARPLARVFLIAIVASAAVAGEPSRAVSVAGEVARPATWNRDQLAALPQAEATVPAPDGRPRIYRGVLLRDLVAAAMPRESDRYALRQSIVVARATDGYLAVFSWAELFNSALGDGVLVATALDGALLADGEGEYALVSAADTRSGPRHVRWLERVELRRVAP